MKNIAIVCGGFSKEEIISFKSAEQIAPVIDQTKYKVYTVLINKETWLVKGLDSEPAIDKSDFSFEYQGQKICFDAVFMAIHGTPGEDGNLQAYFSLLNIPVTTCSPFVSALTFNKFACKAYLEKYDIPSAKAVVLRKEDNYSETEIIEKLGLPIFVKPNNGGSSFGVSKVKKAADLQAALEKAFVEDNELILEEFIEGREFTNGVFINQSDKYILPVTEIVSKTEFFDFEAKYKGLSDEITPAQLDTKETSAVQEMTQHIYALLGCNGVVRIDYLYRDGIFYFMEVNTVPGMSAESIIPQQVKAYGMTITDFYSLLIEDAIQRTNQKLVGTRGDLND